VNRSIAVWQLPLSTIDVTIDRVKFITTIIVGGLLLNPMSAMSQEIIFKDSATGRVLTKDELNKAEGAVRWEMTSTRTVPDDAKVLHQMGRSSGEKGDYGASLAFFEKASELAPDWPYPVYDAAFTYMLLHDFDNALAYYERADKMAPRGFFDVQTAVEALRREEKGELPRGLYLYFTLIEGEGDPEKQHEQYAALTEQFPKFAPAWQKLASLETDQAARLTALENGLAASPDPQTKGYLVVNKALALANLEKKDDAIGLLNSLLLDTETPVNIEAMARITLANILQRE